LDGEAINLAIEELTRDRSAMGLVQANREVYKLLKDGVKVAFQNDEGEETDETVRIIDWNDPANNDFFLASQFLGVVTQRHLQETSRPDRLRQWTTASLHRAKEESR